MALVGCPPHALGLCRPSKAMKRTNSFTFGTKRAKCDAGKRVRGLLACLSNHEAIVAVVIVTNVRRETHNHLCHAFRGRNERDSRSLDIKRDTSSSPNVHHRMWRRLKHTARLPRQCQQHRTPRRARPDKREM